MTDSSEKREDVVYLYINAFDYKEKKYQEAMGGHPTTGRIYRAFYDKESELYRILFDDIGATRYTGLVVKDLVNEDPRWSANMEVLDDDNILNHDISAEDYSKLAQWKEVGNSDVEHLRIEHSNDVSASSVDGLTKIVFSKNKEEEMVTTDLMTAAKHNLEVLHEIDPDIVAAVTLVVQGMISYLESSEPAEPDFTKLMSNSRYHGKGANCGIAVEALTEYLHNESFLASGTLTKAVYYLLREVSRINKQVNDE